MEAESRGSSSRRKSMPLKVKLNFGASKTLEKVNGDDDKAAVEESDSGSSENGSDLPELPEGTVVVQPEPVEERKIRFRGPEFKSSTSGGTKKGPGGGASVPVLENVFCTACGRQVNPWKTGMVKKHKELRVLICRKCYNFLDSGEIAKDEDGFDEQCRWCGEGGRLTVCDKCPRAFCKGCIMRNFGRAAFTAVTESENWECYCCDPSPLDDLKKQCKTVQDAISAGGKKSSKDSSAGGKSSSSTSSASASKPVSSSSATSQSEFADNPAALLSSVLAKLDFDGDSVVPVTVGLLKATTTFRRMLLAVLQASGSQVDTEALSEDSNTPSLFTLLPDMNPSQKKQRCAKVLGKSFQTFVTSMAQMVENAGDKGNNSVQSKSSKTRVTAECNGRSENSEKISAKPATKSSHVSSTVSKSISSGSCSDSSSKGSRNSKQDRPAEVKIPSLSTSKERKEKCDDGKGKPVKVAADLSEGAKTSSGVGAVEKTMKVESMDLDENDQVCEDKKPCPEGKQIKSDKDSKSNKSGAKDLKEIASPARGGGEKVADGENTDKKTVASQEGDGDVFSPSLFPASSQSQDDMSQQEENLFAKLELIQELAEEFCKESADTEKSKFADDCNVDSDSYDLPMVSFGPADPISDKDETSRDLETAKVALGSKGKGNNFSDISDANTSEDEKVSKPEKQKGRDKVKTEASVVEDAGDLQSAGGDGDGESGDEGVEDSDDVSSSDLILSSDGEGRPQPRRRKKNGLSLKKKPAVSSGNGQEVKKRKGSKRRFKTTPKKESHRRLAVNHKPIDIESDSEDSEEEEESDSEKKTKSKKDDKVVKKSTEDDGSESAEGGKSSQKKADKSKDVKDDAEEGAPKKDRARQKKDVDSEEEVEKLEKEVEDLLSGAPSRARKTKEDDEDKSKSAKRKAAPKKDDKTEAEKKGKGKKEKETDSSDSSDEEEDEGEEEVDDFEDDDEDAESSSKKSKKSPQKRQEQNSDLENELAKDAMLDELEEDDDVGKDESGDSSSESDIGAVRKRKATKEEETKEKDEKKNGFNDDDSDFEPAGSRKRFRSKLLDAKVSESDSDEEVVKKKKTGKKRKRESDDESFKGDDDSGEELDEDGGDSVVDSDEVSGGGGDASDDSAAGKKKGKDKKKQGKGKGKEKGKKRRRIKKMKDSSEGEAEEEDGEEGEKGSRKKIRKIKSDKKLRDDTKAAARAEEERRKRVSEKQKKFNGVETKEVGDGQAPITTKLVLEADDETNEPIIQVNPKLICKLKPHQVEAVQFMWDCMFESLERAKKEEGSGCILAHCMGLGKTLSVVSFVHTMMTHAKKTKMKTCLVVCPLNTVLNWLNEWEIWLDENDQLTVYEMASIKQNWARADALEDWHKNGGIMIMGYEMLRNLSQGSRCRNKKQKAIFQKTLLDPGPDIIVCDEGHVMKNAASALSKAMAMIKTRRRVVLTGTPLQNNLIEYHCMVDFVKPNLLGTRKEFANRFVNPIMNGQHSDSTHRDVRIMKARAHILHELLAGCVQRRDYSALTKFLPPKQEYVISVRLSPMQIELYEEYLKRTGQVDGQITTRGAQLFKDYQNLMKIWTHPWVLKLAEIRDELKMKYDDEDSFIDDDDYDEEKSFGSSDSSSEESLPKMSEGEESAGEGTSAGRRSRRLRGRNKSDDKDEIVKEWKTRSRGGEYDDLPVEDTGPQAVSNEWWAQYLKEEDQSRMELSGKLVLLFDILRMCEEIGDKVLIFSQSLLSLDIIEYFLEHVDSKFQADTEHKPDEELKEEFGKRWTKGEDYFRLDGSTSAQMRSHWANIFNQPENHRARLFIISTRAGGLGINLVGANRVIIFDASWNPSHDVQSIFRVYRFGQTKPCYIYRFLAQGTMEEKIYDRQVTKLSLSQRVVDEHQIERHFTAADLQELYAFRPERLSDDKERPTLMLPKDVLLAEIMSGDNKDWFVSLHEHDSLLENLVEQTLTEEEKKAAWEDYENEKKGLRMNMPQMYGGPGLGNFLSQEYLLQTARNLREQHPDMPQDVLQAHLQRIIMMQIRQKQEEQRRLELMQRQQEAQMAQMMQHNALLQAQYMQSTGSMYPQMMPPGTRFSPSLYAHMAQPGLSAYHSGMAASSSAPASSSSSSTSTTGQKGAASKGKAQEVIDLDESN